MRDLQNTDLRNRGYRRDPIKIGAIAFQVIFGDIKDLEADALVQPAGTSPEAESMHVSPWVQQANIANSISDALQAHHPFNLGDVLVTPAGSLKSKYLFSAVVMDWAHQNLSDQLLSDDVVTAAANTCVNVALALGIKSIAFTPWGIRVSAIEASRVTALMMQSIISTLTKQKNALETVYLISNNEAHCDWFSDRVFIFKMVYEQVTQVRDGIDNLSLTSEDKRQIDSLLGVLLENLVFRSHISIDQSQYIAANGGTIAMHGGIAVGGSVSDSSVATQ